MNQPEDPAAQGSSHGGTAYHPFPGAGGMPFGSETVVIPGRRPNSEADVEAAGSGNTPSSLPEMTPTERSKLWNRLFPAPDPDQSAAALDLLAQGMLIKNYVIEKRIGVGGMGAVFRAWDEDLERIVALKVLSPSYCRDPLAVKRFRNESRSAARLDHDNIARVHGIGESHGLHFIAFEYVEGTNIRDLIRQQTKLNIAEALSYILQIVAALKHTAAAHVFHRDIKPSNIIVKPNGRAKLVDWGLARLNNRGEDSVDLTSAGTTLGTFDYISPEQARDPRSVDLRSDIYSLGCTFYHMVTGDAPYSTGTMLQKLLDHQNKTVPNPSVKNPAVSPELASIIMRMMASDPSRRYQDAESLLEDLYAEAEHYHLTAIPAESVIFARPMESIQEPVWRRHIGLISIVTLLLLMVIGVERFNAMTYSQEATPFLSSTQPVSPSPAPSNTSESIFPQFGISNSYFDGIATKFFSNSNSVYRPSDDFRSFIEEMKLPGQLAASAEVRQPEDIIPEEMNVASEKTTLTSPEKVIKDPGIASTATTKANPFAGLGADAVPTELGSGSLSGTEFLTGASGLIPKTSPAASPPLEASSLPGTSIAKVAESKPVLKSNESVLPLNPVTIPAAETSPISRVIFEVARPSGPSTRYNTLKAAIEGAQQDQFIRVTPVEGPGEIVITESIVIDNKNVNIRGDLSNPVHLIFRPSSMNSSEELFLLSNSSTLMLQGLNITVDLTEKQTGPEIALSTVMDESQFQLRNTTVTLNSGMYRRAVLANLTSDFRMMQADSFSHRVRPSISMEASMVRGVGSVILTQRTHAAQISVSRSGIAVQGAMIFSQIQGMSPPGGGKIDVELERSTIATTRGLFEAEQDPMAMDLLSSSIEAHECIFLNLGDYPLISLSGNDTKEGLLGRFEWTGDFNFFDRYSIMMLISEVSTDEEDYKELGQSDWMNHWRYTRSTYFDRIAWKNPDLIHANMLTWKRADFALDDFNNEENPALNLGVGVEANELPSFFEETASGRGKTGRLGIGRELFNGLN